MTPPETRLGELGERQLTQHIQGRIPVAEVPVGVGDDAAAVDLAPHALVTTDVLVEGVHFVREVAPARLLGRKALTVSGPSANAAYASAAM